MTTEISFHIYIIILRQVDLPEKPLDSQFDHPYSILGK